MASSTKLPRRNLLAAGIVPAIRKAQARRPNVLFLLTDDQRADTIGALGNAAISTPHLDSLARQAVVFQNAYCLGGNVPAVCTPSRNMILSGRVFTRYDGQASGEEPNFPVSMREAGYETYHEGKRGNTAVQIQAKFEVNRYLDDAAARNAAAPGKQIADNAIRFLKERETTRPFFMYLAFEAPHDPRIPRPQDAALYVTREIPLPANYLPVHPFDNGEMTVRDELLAPWPRTPAEIQRHLRDYYAVITGLDYQIGRILDVVRSRPEYQNTIVVFSSDQGLAIGSHGLMGKQNLYDHSMKVPLLISGPGIRPGYSRSLVYLMDIFPTVLDLVGAPVPEGLDGRSFRACIDQPSRPARSELFLAYRGVQRAIRDRRYKLIVYPEINRRQFFDLQNDPDEKHDLAAKPENRGLIEKLLRGLESLQKQYADTLPLESKNPKSAAWTPPRGEELNEIRARWRMPPL